MSENIQKNIINPNFVILLAFFSTLKNANIYLFGKSPHIPVLLDYLFLLFVIFCFISIFIQVINLKQINLKVMYIFPLLLWVILQSIVLTLFTNGEYLPRNLITSLLALIVIILGVSNSKTLRGVISAFGIGALISVLIPLIFFPDMIGRRSVNVYGIIYEGGFWNNALISFASAAWIYIALAVNNGTKKTKLLAFITFGIAWIASFAGLSRTLILITVISITFYLMYIRKFKSILKISVIIIVLVTLIINLFPNIIEEFNNRLSANGNLFEDESRVNIWKSYLSNIPEFFFVGSLESYREFGPNGLGPHSAFLNWFVQYGIIGLVGFIYLIMGLIKEINIVKRKSRNEAAFLWVWLISYISLALINQTGFVETSFYVAFGIVLSWTILHKKDVRSLDSEKIS
ncbi:hypothetical protein FZC74_06840 [Sutcliffiella horikoshii]|uniref:O-antigen ligase-related domain-containing protein n=1 Tax=Sutcliffiella horikoshii TaxID=79883 RepID=A0AA94WRU1_9BACI|nr:O-antigen ligase family protein [Sutcliffiella horikoshii]TYS59866.1 hypothetical protein FZC74_06840 [Sutcliffiella horikoshii]